MSRLSTTVTSLGSVLGAGCSPRGDLEPACLPCGSSGPLGTCPHPRSLETSNPFPSGPSQVSGHLSHIFQSGETPRQSPVPAHNHPHMHTRMHRGPACLCVTSIPPQNPIPAHTQRCQGPSKGPHCLRGSTALGTGPPRRSQAGSRCQGTGLT